MVVRVLVGDALERLRELESESVQLCLTSPPYFQLRDYGVDGQIGLEQTPAAFIAKLVTVFDEVKRVLRKDGLCFVVLGDSYAGSFKGNVPGPNSIVGHRWRGSSEQLARTPTNGIPAKNLLLIPERFAIAMQDAGWYVRSRIAWCLSGGTQVYVRSQKGDMSMSVKDMARLKPETLQVWNGERWTQVLRMWESTDTGDPLEIELRSGERIGCSPNHQWPTERGLIHAKDLVVGDKFKRVRLPEPEAPRKPSALDDADIGWFVGLYLAEGGPGTNAINIASHVKEIERFERCQRIAESFDGSASMHRVAGQAATIRVYGRILRAIIDEYIYGKGAYGKHLTNACWRRSDVFLRGLLDGYLHGDGHWDEKNQRWRLGFARNYEFAADLRTLCARLGVSLRLRPRFATLNGRRFPTFRGEIRFTRAATLQPKSDDEIVGLGFSRGRKFWDIEVADEPHTFALASGILTHNCKTSAMPESVRDRPTSAWEHIWMFSRARTYYYDAEAVKQPLVTEPHAPGNAKEPSVEQIRGANAIKGMSGHYAEPDRVWGSRSGANLRNYWLLGPEPQGSMKIPTRVDVSVDDADDGTERTTSPDCPIHARRPASTARRGEPLAVPPSRTRHNGTGPVQASLIEDAPTEGQSSGQPANAPSLGAPSAIGHSTPSSRTDPHAATSPADTASEGTSPRTGGNPIPPDGESPRLDILASSISMVDLASRPSLRTEPDTVGTSSGRRASSPCTCSYSKVIIQETAHYASYPTELVRRCILAGSRKGDTVLDPFLGSGTTAVVASRLERDCIGIELNESYARMAERRVNGDCPMFNEVTVEGEASEAPPRATVSKQDGVGKSTYTGFNARWKASREASA